MSLALWFNLDPVRPWEWNEIDASAWMEAVMIRNAYAEGQEDARAEADMQRRLAQQSGPVA